MMLSQNYLTLERLKEAVGELVDAEEEVDTNIQPDLPTDAYNNKPKPE